MVDIDSSRSGSKLSMVINSLGEMNAREDEGEEELFLLCPSDCFVEKMDGVGWCGGVVVMVVVIVLP